jgi:hypothetical protein
VNNISD